MYARDNTYSSADQADFSSVFMRATTAEQLSALQMLDENAVRSIKNGDMQQGKPGENRNLSSIITQIQDEGAAKPPVKKVVHWNRKNQPEKKVTAAANKTQRYKPQLETAGTSQPEPVETPSDIDMPAFYADKNIIPEKKKPRQWLPLLLALVLAVAAVMGYNLYRLNNQAVELNATLISYEEQLDEKNAVQDQSIDALGAISTMKQELAGIQQTLSAIKADYAEFGNKLIQTEIKAREPQKKEIATVKQNVTELESGLANTRNEMTAIREAIEQVKDKLTVSANPAVPDAKPVMTQPATGWVVNLASLSSAEQAQIGVSMLEKSGKSPVIQETMVNGEKVYRLSVEGFSTRIEAMQFINKAKQQYGFDGGWVRPR